MQNKQTQFERSLADLEMAIQSGRITDPLIQEYWRRGLSPLKNGEHSAKAQAILEKLLTGPSILAGMALPAEPPEPDLDPKQLIAIGQRRIKSGKTTGILLALLSMHLLIQGPTGTGKTNLIWGILKQLIDFGIKVIFHDHKNEGRKLLRRYPSAIVLRISDFRENFFKPVGDPKQYYTMFWSSFARTYRTRRETESKLITLSLRLYDGLTPEEQCLSIYDFSRILRKRAKSEKDASLETAANAIESLIASMGDAAMVREGRCADDLFRIVVIQCHGLPSEFLDFFMEIRMYRMHLRAIAKGHSGDLDTALVSDEGGMEFGREFTSDAGSGYITPQKRLITQFRSAGTALIIATQSVSAIDPAVISNVGSFVCLKAQSDADVRISARLLNMPEEHKDQIRNPPRWTGWLKSPSHMNAVAVDIAESDMGDYMSDAELDARNKPSLDKLNEHVVMSPVRNDTGSPLSYREILGETDQQEKDAEPIDFDFRDEHRAFVQEIISHPDASIVKHYENLGWSAGRGTRVKGELLDNGIIEAVRQTSRNGRPVDRLTITKEGMAHYEQA